MSTSPSDRYHKIQTILLVIILALLIFQTYEHFRTQLSKEVESETDSLIEPDPSNQQDDENKYFEKQDTIESDFSGLKNKSAFLTEEVINTIANELEVKNWNEELKMEDLGSLSHEIVYHGLNTSDIGPGMSLMVITFTSSSNNNCHSCAGLNSFFEFRKKGGYWLLTRKSLAFSLGTEFNSPSDTITIETIGTKNKFAVIVHNEYSFSFGHDFNMDNYYTSLNDTMKLVLELKTYEYYNDPLPGINYLEGFVNTRIIKSNKEFFDIETTFEKDDWDPENGSLLNRYLFNGTEYIESKVPQPKQGKETHQLLVKQ